jgi:hypothetical protein
MSDERLRYVVLRHEGVDPPHFDLMFETGPSSPLSTWRAAEWPLPMMLPLTHLPDHRPWYLTYEGELSNNRGWVRRVAAGTHSIQSDHVILLVTRLEDGTILRLFRGPHAVGQVLRAAQ